MLHRRRRPFSITGSLVLAVAMAGFTALAAPPATSAATPAANGTSPSYNGLALTPPMGFNDWYQYNCNITEDEILANAQALVSSGLAKLGYNYVNLDDCWMAPARAGDGQLQADPVRFPHGIAWLADQVHAMGLKLGVYESVGTRTCKSKPGSLGHYQQDADTFASWGVDFLKFDYCGVPSSTDPSADYQEMSQDLVATGRPIAYSEELPIEAGNANSADPRYLPLVSFSSKISNMWRIAPDLTTNYASTVMGHFTEDLPLAGYAHPGAWNDLDMLATGSSTFKWTAAQQQTQMSIWAELASPLIVSTDLTNMSASTEQILSNTDVIAVDQDPLGKQGQLVSQQGPVYVVAKSLSNGDAAVLFVNTSQVAQQASTTAQAAGLPSAGGYGVRDLWAHTTRESAGVIAATVPPQSAVLYRVSPLHSEVNQLPPVTDVSVTPQVPAAYPGSQFQVAQPGQTITVPASFRNDGREAVTSASLSLGVPGGWAVSGAPVSAGAVPTGKEIDGSWQVTIPPGTPAGNYAVSGNASYQWSDGTQTASNTGESGFEVAPLPAGTPYLDQLSWLSETTSQGSGVVLDKNVFGGPLSIHGTVYPHGLWVNSIATINYYLGGNCSQFTADLGLDDSDMGAGAVDYQLYADGTKIYDSGVVTNTTPTVHADVNVAGAHVLQLYVGEGNGTVNFGNADFGSPQLTCNS